MDSFYDRDMEARLMSEQDSSGMINGADIKIDGGYTIR